MPICARCQKQVNFVQRDYLYEHKEICPNCSHILQRIYISREPIDQLPCHDCGDLTFLDEGEYEKISEEDHSTTFRCKDCVWQIERNKRVANGESKLVTISDTSQYAILEELDARRNYAFMGNGHNFDPDDPDEPLQLHFTYSETGHPEDTRELIYYGLGLHNKDVHKQDFYETDWMMFLDDETDIIDLFWSVRCWNAVDRSDFYCELRYDDPFVLELLKLAREKWPVYDADMGHMRETVEMLQEQKIGEIIGTEWMQRDGKDDFDVVTDSEEVIHLREILDDEEEEF